MDEIHFLENRFGGWWFGVKFGGDDGQYRFAPRLREWQRVYGSLFPMETSGFMSVCGAVLVKAHLTGSICISFGCLDAREHGAIGRDRLAIGLPMRLVTRLREKTRTAHSPEPVSGPRSQ